MKPTKPKILVLASGDAEGGGSGFQELVEFSRTVPAILDAETVAAVSNYENGGVKKRSKKLVVPFEFFPKPYTAENYQYFIKKYKADFVMCSGWLPFVRGIDPRKIINIHPGPIPQFGGKGMWGHHVHEAVMEAYRRGEIKQSAVTMHFVDEVSFDHGAKIFELPVMIREDDDAEKLGSRVNEKERAWQSYILNLVVHEHIRLVNGPSNGWQVIAVQKNTGIIPGFSGVYI